MPTFLRRACMIAMLLSSAAQAEPKPLEVIVFPGGFNWPIWAAEASGAFTRNDVAVHLTDTPSSVFQLTNLIDGKFDIAITAIDNLIAYDEGQGEAPTARAPDLIAVMGGDNGFLHLVTAPDVPDFAALKGKVLSVDAMTTGFAFVLQRLIELGGLQPGDVTFVRAGGVLQRFNALLAGQHAGTLLISPFEVVATSKGFHDLADATSKLSHYQGLVTGVRREWAATHRTELVGFLRAYMAGLDWLYDPANKAAAIGILRQHLPNMTEDLAQRSYALLVEPERGFARHAALDAEGLAQVLALRSRYGQPQKTLDSPAKYYDPSYYEQATR